MPPKIEKQLVACLEKIEAAVKSPAWLTTEDATVEIFSRLYRQLGELASLQRPFEPIDADIPWDVRSDRLLKWLRTAPAFKSVDVAIEVNRVAGKSNRGVVTKEAIKQGDVIMCIPPDCMLDTEIAWLGDELGQLVRDPRFDLAGVFPLLLALVGMIEHAKCIERASPDRLEVPPVVPRAPLRAAFRGAPDDAGAGDAHSVSHGHSHGGVPCHGHGHAGSHGHGPASPAVAAPPPSGGSHGHSHGGVPCDGHGHASAASTAVAAPPPSGGSHGHSHGGVPCDGHGHGHGHGAAHAGGPVPRSKLNLSHPWGSPLRAFLSVLPSQAELQVAVYYTPAHLEALRGTPLFQDAAIFVRHAAKSYLGLYNLLGTGGLEAVEGFAPHFTWESFRCYMAFAMSRMNRVSPEDDGIRLPGHPGHNLALIPLFDMVNHAPGLISTWFDVVDGPGTPTVLGLNAMRDFAPGDELRMSYGGRPPTQLVMYAGFITEDPATNEAHLPVLLAVSPAEEADRLARLRITILNGLKITPVHYAARIIRSDPALVERLRRQESGLLSKDESDALDRRLWTFPFSFSIRGNGAPSQDLLSFLRVRAINNKADAAEALKQSDQSRRRAETALAEYRAAQEAAASAGEDPNPHGRDHFQLPQLQVGVLSAENEATALAALRALLLGAVAAMEPSALKPAVAAALDPEDPVVLFRANLVRLYHLGVAWVDSQGSGGAAPAGASSVAGLA